MNIENLINHINSRRFYTYLIEDLNYDYCGSCPCFNVIIPEYNIELNCSCWRTGDFEYSGLHVKDLDNKYNIKDLEKLTLTIMKFIYEIWGSTTSWEYRINDGNNIKYELALKIY